MAQLNWQQGMWPSPWDYPGQGPFMEGSMKRSPSSQSMSAAGADAMMWGPQMHPAMMMHPSMYPYPGMGGSMVFNGSQNQLSSSASGSGPAASNESRERASSPASSAGHRSRNSSSTKSSSHQRFRRHRQERNGSSSRSSSLKPSNRRSDWSDSEDEQYTGNEEEVDSADERPVSHRKSQRSHREQQQQPQPQPQPPPAPQPSRSSASERKESKIYGRVSPMTQKRQESRGWECEHCTFLNEPGTRICAVCCRTSHHTRDMADEDSGRKSPDSQPSTRKSPEKSSSIEFADEDPDVEITSNLSFNIKKDDTKDTTSSGIQLKHEVVKEKKRSADYQDIVKDYEDVSNMLRRMRLKKEEQLLQQQLAEQQKAEMKAHKPPPDDIELDDEDESEVKEKDSYYEQVQYPQSAEGNYYIYSSGGYSRSSNERIPYRY